MTRCLYQDRFKAVMLAHQYKRVSRIAWLAAKNAYELLNCFSVVRCVVQSKSVYYRALHCKKRRYLLSGEIQEGYSM